MKKQNKGFTLVEMVIAMAVFAIVLMEVAMVMSNATKVYSRSTYDLTVQNEASTSVQIIEDLMVDATESIAVLPSLVPGSDKIQVSNWIDKAAGTKETYTIELKMDVPGKPYGNVYIDKGGANQSILASNVTAINLYTGNYATNSTVTLDMSFESEQGYEYKVQKDIYNRNEIGVGGIVEPNVTTSDGNKTICALRYHEYNLKSFLPYTATWVSAEWEKPLEAAVHYSLSFPTLKCNDVLNGAWDTSAGSYKIICKDSNDNEYSFNVYTDKVEMAGGNYNMFYLYMVNASKFTSFIPVKGVSIEDMDSADITFNMGTVNLLTKNGVTFSSPEFSIPSKNFPSDTDKKFRCQIDGNVKLGVDKPSNSITLEASRLNPDGTSYGKFLYQYEVLMNMNIKMKWGSKEKDFKLYVYPVGDTGIDLTPNQQTKFWSLVNSGGGSNDSYEVRTTDDGT